MKFLSLLENPPPPSKKSSFVLLSLIFLSHNVSLPLSHPFIHYCNNVLLFRIIIYFKVCLISFFVFIFLSPSLIFSFLFFSFSPSPIPSLLKYLNISYFKLHHPSPYFQLVRCTPPHGVLHKSIPSAIVSFQLNVIHYKHC